MTGLVKPPPRQDLSPLLAARSVAIVGISGPDRFGGILFQNLEAFGYPGQIFGVNPRHETLYGRPCYPSLSDIPETPDCVLLAVPDRGLEAALKEAVACGIPAGVIFGGARSEDEEDPPLSERLETIAREGGMVLCGPNGMGFVSMAQRLPVTGYWAHRTVRTGGVTLIAHSGSVWDAFLQNDRGLGFNYIVSSGSEALTSAADYMQFSLADPSTRVIGLFLETVRDPETFVLALSEASQRDVPVVVLKTGRSARGAEFARAHSGALAGQDEVYDALFRRYGVSRCSSIDEFMDTLELFASGIRPRLPKVSALHDSGGQRALLVDLADPLAVEFAEINDRTRGKLAAVLEPGLEPVNPLDAWGTGNDADSIYEACLRALDDDPETGLNLVACDLYPTDDAEMFYPKIAEATLGELKNPLVWMVHLSSSTSPLQAAALRELGVPVLMGTETGLRALSHLLAYAKFQKGLSAGWDTQERLIPPPAQLESFRRELQPGSDPLGEHASKRLLAAYGLSITRERLVKSEAEAIAAAEAIGYPLVVKTAGGELHKTEHDGIRLGVRDKHELVRVYGDFAERLGPAALIQEWVPDGPDLLVGLVNDPQFGPMLSLGTGGIFVEVFNDICMLALPTTGEQVRQALAELRGAGLLAGTRGGPVADVEAAVQAALGLAALARDLGDAIAELDINPLRLSDQGAVVLDALIIPQSA